MNEENDSAAAIVRDACSNLVISVNPFSAATKLLLLTPHLKCHRDLFP